MHVVYLYRQIISHSSQHMWTSVHQTSPMLSSRVQLQNSVWLVDDNIHMHDIFMVKIMVGVVKAASQILSVLS